MVSKRYVEFENARQHARHLNLKNRTAWVSYCKSGKKPINIPSDPRYHYLSKWLGWGDFLGTGNIAHHKRSFWNYENARAFVKKLGLKGRSDWQSYCASGEKPPQLPSHLHKIYKSNWYGYADFFGNGDKSPRLTGYRSFDDAKKFAQSLGLKTYIEWINYCKTDKKPADIPREIATYYKNEWKGVGDFLGTGKVAYQNREYLSYDDAKVFVHKLELKNTDEWREYCRSNKKPDNIPTVPWKKYKNKGWRGIGDFLGTGRIANQNREYLSYHECKEFAKKNNINTKNGWFKYTKSNTLPANIPSDPPKRYKDVWVTWGDFFDTGRIANQNREFLSYEEAIKFLAPLRLKTNRDYAEYCKSGNKPQNIPSSPQKTYKDKFISISIYLSVDSKRRRWTAKSLVNFVTSLSDVIGQLEPSELLSIIQSNNIPLRSLPNDSLPRMALEMALEGKTDKASQLIHSMKTLTFDDEEDGLELDSNIDEEDLKTIQDSNYENSNPCINLPNLVVFYL